MSNDSIVQPLASEMKNEGSEMIERNQDPRRISLWNRLIQKNLEPVAWRQKKLGHAAQCDNEAQVKEEDNLKQDKKQDDQNEKELEKRQIEAQEEIKGEEKRQADDSCKGDLREDHQTHANRTRRWMRSRRQQHKANENAEMNVIQKSEKIPGTESSTAQKNGQAEKEIENSTRRQKPILELRKTSIQEKNSVRQRRRRQPKYASKQGYRGDEENMSLGCQNVSVTTYLKPLGEDIEEQYKMERQKYYGEFDSRMWSPYWSDGKFDHEKHKRVLEDLFEEMAQNKNIVACIRSRYIQACPEQVKKPAAEVSQEQFLKAFQASLDRNINV